MKLAPNFSKKILLPSVAISVLALLTTPVITNLEKANNKTSQKKSSDSDNVVNKILASFKNDVFAESNLYGCYNSSFSNPVPDACAPTTETQNICVQDLDEDNNPKTVNLSFHMAGTLEYVPTSASVNQNTMILPTPVMTFTPANQTYSNSSPTQTFNTSFTAPTLDDMNPSLTIPVNLVAQFASIHDTQAKTIFSNVTVFHNTAPVLDNYSPSTFTQFVGAGTANLPVSVTVTDPQGNDLHFVFQISTDNFATILQTQTYSSVASGSTQNHTFTNLPQGNYAWRALVTEENHDNLCLGATEVDPGSELGITTPTGTVTMTSTPPAYVSSVGQSTVQVGDNGSATVPVQITFADIDTSTVSYTFQLSTDSNFSSILQTGSANGVNQGTSAGFSFSNLAPGRYYWRVVASDGTSTTLSQVFAFDVTGPTLASTGREIVSSVAVGFGLIAALAVLNRKGIAKVFKKSK